MMPRRSALLLALLIVSVPAHALDDITKRSTFTSHPDKVNVYFAPGTAARQETVLSVNGVEVSRLKPGMFRTPFTHFVLPPGRHAVRIENFAYGVEPHTYVLETEAGAVPLILCNSFAAGTLEDGARRLIPGESCPAGKWTNADGIGACAETEWKYAKDADGKANNRFCKLTMQQTWFEKGMLSKPVVAKVKDLTKHPAFLQAADASPVPVSAAIPSRAGAGKPRSPIGQQSGTIELAKKDTGRPGHSTGQRKVNPPAAPAVADQLCKPADARFVHEGDACRNGRIHGNATLLQTDGKRRIQGTFVDGALIKGTMHYLDYDGSWGSEYEGEWSIGDPHNSGQPQFIRHGQGRSYALRSTRHNGALVPTRFWSYDGFFHDHYPHGDGFCRAQQDSQPEACTFDMGVRVDEVFRLRQALKREREQAQQCARKLSAAGSSLELAQKRLRQHYDTATSGCLTDSDCMERQHFDFWMEASSAKRYMDEFRGLQCPNPGHLAPLEEAYDQMVEHVHAREARMHAVLAAQEAQQKREAAEEHRLIREADARWWRETTQNFMKPDAFWRGIEQTQARTLANIADTRARMQTSYSGELPDMDQSASYSPETQRIEAQLEATEKAAAATARIREAREKCRDTGGRWTNERCESRAAGNPHPQNLERQNCFNAGKTWTGSSCDYSTTVEVTGHGGGAKSSASTASKPTRWAGTTGNVDMAVDGAAGSTGGSSGSSSAGKSARTSAAAQREQREKKTFKRFIPVFAQKENPYSWGTQEQACQYAKNSAIRKAENQCRSEYKHEDGEPATADDKPDVIPVDANCQSCRETSQGFKCTGNVILQCRLRDGTR